MLTLTALLPSLSMTTRLPRVYSVCGDVLLILFELVFATDVPEKFCRTGIPACPIRFVGRAFLVVPSSSRDRQECLSCSVSVTDSSVCPTVGTYVNGRRLPLQGRGWGFESLRAYQKQVSDNQRSESNAKLTSEI